MEYSLAITFLTAAGEKSTLSISGDLVNKSGAQLTQRQVTKYEVA